MVAKEAGRRRWRNCLAKKIEGAQEWGKTLESSETLKDGGV
jgi:hypothetical protein